MGDFNKLTKLMELGKLTFLEKILEIIVIFLDPKGKRIVSYRKAVKYAMEYRKRDLSIKKSKNTKNKKRLRIEKETLWKKFERTLIIN